MTILLVLLAFLTGAHEPACSEESASRFDGYDRLVLNRNKFICEGYYSEARHWLFLNVEGLPEKHCDVPKEIWAALKKAPDYGLYYNLRIQGRYAC